MGGKYRKAGGREPKGSRGMSLWEPGIGGKGSNKKKKGMHYFEERGGKKAKTERSKEVETVC